LNFDQLGLTPALLRAVGDMGLYAPTPIQAEAIPAALKSADVWATAPTGSGKTLAFALPLLQHLLASPRQTNFRRPVRTLVLVPTRELAVQVGDVLANLAYKLPQSLKVNTVFGGVSVNPQMMALRGGADIVVATPGRLLDLIDQNAVRLADVQHLVLDEADRLLDLGFADELQRVLALLPAKRQTLLFSATFAPEVEALAANLLRDPVRITVEAFEGHKPDITQRAIRVDEKSRTALLRHLITENGWKQVLVFVATRYACEHVANKLYKAGVFATPFHGEMSQGARQEVLERIQGRTLGRGGHHRSGLTRHRHRHAARGGQLRPAALSHRLHPPHWPHRQGGGAWRRGELCDSRSARALAADPEARKPGTRFGASARL
jgi:ATP-dependent RNA helicase RhlE